MSAMHEQCELLGFSLCPKSQKKIKAQKNKSPIIAASVF